MPGQTLSGPQAGEPIERVGGIHANPRQAMGTQGPDPGKLSFYFDGAASLRESQGVLVQAFKRQNRARNFNQNCEDIVSKRHDTDS